MDKVTLLPCPFCGGEATHRWHSSPECWIECTKCFAVGPNDGDTTTAQHEQGWNTRATPAPDSEKLREADEAHRLACVLRIAQASSNEHGEDMIRAAGMLDRLIYLPAISGASL